MEKTISDLIPVFKDGFRAEVVSLEQAVAAEAGDGELSEVLKLCRAHEKAARTNEATWREAPRWGEEKVEVEEIKRSS